MGAPSWTRRGVGRTAGDVLWRRSKLGLHLDPCAAAAIAACLAGAAGRREIALALAHERLGMRPRSVPNRRFLRQAEAIAN